MNAQDTSKPEPQTGSSLIIVSTVMVIAALLAPIVIQTTWYTSEITIISLLWSLVLVSPNVETLPPGFMFNWDRIVLGHPLVVIAFLVFAIVRVVFAFLVVRYVEGKVTATRTIGFGLFAELLPAPLAPILIFPGTYVWTPTPIALVVALILMKLGRQKS